MFLINGLEEKTKQDMKMTPTESICGQFYRLLQKLVQNETCVITIYAESNYYKLQQSVIKISDWFVAQIYDKQCHSFRQQEKMVLQNAASSIHILKLQLVTADLSATERDLEIIYDLM